MQRKTKSTRREFVVGKAAIDAISDLPSQLDSVEDAESSKTTAANRKATYLVQVARDAMACEFQVLLNAGQHEAGVEAALEALDLVESIEDQLTVYRAHSEVSRVNQTANGECAAVSAELFKLLQTSSRLHAETKGAFDITAAPLGKTWGFHRREGRHPTKEAIDAALQQVGSQWLELDDEHHTVRFRRAGMEINFGGIGKGYALDRAAELLRRANVENFLIHGGRSSLLARGARMTESAAGGWWIAVRHPLRQQQQLAEVVLRDRALGTSGSGNQFFHFGGKRYGHVLDPRTGFPADQLLSATALAPTAARADALATAFFVMGLERSLEFCESRPELGALLACPGKRAGEVVLHTHGLKSDDWVALSPVACGR